MYIKGTSISNEEPKIQSSNPLTWRIGHGNYESSSLISILSFQVWALSKL